MSRLTAHIHNGVRGGVCVEGGREAGGEGEREGGTEGGGVLFKGSTCML